MQVNVGPVTMKFIVSVHSCSQPVVLTKKEGESEKEMEARTPFVYLIGSSMNVAMYANTLTAATKDAEGNFVVCGRQYPSMMNAL